MYQKWGFGGFTTHCLYLSLSLRRTFSTRPLTNTHDWPAASASEATALRRYTNLIIIIIIIRGEDVKILCSNSKRHYLRESASVDVLHVKVGSTAWALGLWKYFAYKESRKKIGGNFWLYGEK